MYLGLPEEQYYFMGAQLSGSKPPLSPILSGSKPSLGVSRPLDPQFRCPWYITKVFPLNYRILPLLLSKIHAHGSFMT